MAIKDFFGGKWFRQRHVFICLIMLLCTDLSEAAVPLHKTTCKTYISEPENIKPGIILFNVTSTDSDTNDFITITADSVTNKYTNISRNSGNSPLFFSVTLSHDIDRETDVSPIKLRFTATDKDGNQDTIRCDLYITDVNDNAPVFQNLPYTWELPENATASTSYSSISATDADQGTNADITYSMVPTTQSLQRQKEYNDTFSIDPNTRVVTLKKAIDYEQNNYYQFNVTATDGGGVKTHTNLIIRVLDVQDTPPFFARKSYRETIKEEVAIGSSVATVYAEDGDKGVPNEIGYRFTGGMCQYLFNISDNGNITTRQRIDRDNGTVLSSGTCDLTVQAFEKNTSGQTQYGNTTASVTVTVDVADIDDNPPRFSHKTINATVMENTPANVPVTLLSGLNVSDVDQGANADIDLSVKWHNGTNCSDFTAQPVTVSGSADVVIIVQNSSILDYEKVKQLEFQVTATGGNNHSHTDTVNVILDILDVNDNNPVFDKNNTCQSVMENVMNGTKLCTINATDEDTTSAGKLIYSITGGNNRLVVNSTTGEIYTKCSTNCSTDFDRETYSDIPVSCTVEDEGGRLDYLPLTFHVVDVNDNIPTFYRSEFENFISENDGNYTKIPVVKLDASDKDATSPNNQVTYSLLDEGLAANFTCNSTTGEIFLKSALDYEELTNTSGEVILTALVTDKGTPPLNSTAKVVVKVQDLNDNYPTFEDTPYRRSVPEDATSNLTARTNVINITAHDDDGTRQNKELHFYIAGGAGDNFAINSTTGQLYVQVNAKLDRETTPLYNITVTAMDQGSPSFTSTTSVIINVTDVNDEPPRFYPTSFSAEVHEETNDSVIKVTANDSDSNSDLRYSIADAGVKAFDELGKEINSSLVKNYFVIDNITGVISATTNADRETAERVILTVVVTDINAVHNKPQTATAQVEITLLDVNDNSPTFDNSSYNVSVIENAQNGYMLLQVHATDIDENRTITYTLANTDWPNGTFKLDKQTGKLTKVGQLDRESKPGGDLTVTATDNGVPPLNSTETIYIKVLDFNDNAPIFKTPNKTVDVREDAKKGSSVLCMDATDEDEGPNSNVTYEISSGGKGNFSMNATSGCISVANSLDRERIPAYTLILTAFDNPVENNTRKSTTTSLSVVIDDVNDNDPKFTPEQYSAKFPEDRENGSVVLTVTATDADDGNNSKLTYEMRNTSVPDRLLSGTESWPFQINETTGTIRITENLKDKVGNYSLVVVASDHGVPNRSSSATVTLEVLDVNLWNPVITNLPTDNTIPVFECVQPRSIIYTFDYTDKDFGINSYASFNMSNLDSISLTTFNLFPNGSLSTKTKLDARYHTLYKFQVQATDHGTPALSSDKLTITVKVLDVNDHLPSFDGHNISASIPENTTDVLVTTVTAIDVDKNSNSCYSIANGSWSGHFNVTPHGGEILIIDEFDYEQIKEVNVVVNVKDCSIDVNTTVLCLNTTFPPANKTQTVNVHIQDVDDNPPKFISTISTGMRRTAEPGTVLKIHLRSSSYITDLDSPRNGYLSWKFANGGEIIPSENLKVKINTSDGVNPCGNTSGVHHIFCIDGNGTITSNKLFREDLFGFFKVPVRVYDKAGSDTTTIKVYLIGDTQILMMVVLDEKANVDKDKIFKAYGSITGHTFVYDGIEDHKEGGRVDPSRSDLYFHVVDIDGENVLSAVDAERLVDDNAGALTSVQRIYHISQITSSREVALKESNTSLKFYVAVAIASALALTLIIVSYAGLSTKSKYKQKLRAATIKSIDMSTEMIDGSLAVPGSNQYSRQFNPLLNEKVEATYDKISLSSNNSIDENAVDASPNQATVYDRMEEREVSLDMYGEDTFQSTMQEDPLDVALRMHEQLKESADQHSAKTDSIVGGNFSKGYDANSEDSDAGNPDGHPKELHFHNHAFDDMESTEI